MAKKCETKDGTSAGAKFGISNLFVHGTFMKTHIAMSNEPFAS